MCCCQSLTDNTLKVPEPDQRVHTRGEAAAAMPSSKCLGSAAGNIPRTRTASCCCWRGPAKPQADAAPLTLAGAAHGVIAPEGLCPAGQARGASPVFRLAVGAAQLPADQGLDVLDCGRRREEPSHAVRRAVRVSVAGPGDSGPRSLQGAGHGLLTPDTGLQPP